MAAATALERPKNVAVESPRATTPSRRRRRRRRPRVRWPLARRHRSACLLVGSLQRSLARLLARSLVGRLRLAVA